MIVHYPEAEEGKRELTKRAAGIHADMVIQYIRQLNCPSEQKIELLNAVIRSASTKKAGVQTL